MSWNYNQWYNDVIGEVNKIKDPLEKIRFVISKRDHFCASNINKEADQIEKRLNRELDRMKFELSLIKESSATNGAPQSIDEDITLDQIFDFSSKLIEVKKILAEEGKIDFHTGLWKDGGAGNKGYLASLIKYLHIRGYYKGNAKPTNDQVRSICQNTFGCTVSLDTVKKAKADDFEFKYIPPASTIE